MSAVVLHTYVKYRENREYTEITIILHISLNYIFDSITTYRYIHVCHKVLIQH